MTLAMLAGSTVAAAATTDAWEAASYKLAQLLGHGDPAKTKLMEQRLTETHEQLIGAEGASLESARETLAAQWVALLTDLLEEYPAIEADLRALVEEMHVALPAGAVSPTDNVAVVPQDMDISGGRGWFDNKAIPKDVVPLDPTSPGLATS